MIVQKGNKQLRVDADRLEDLRARGFVQVDEKTGKPMVKEPADELKALKKENAALKKQLAALTENGAQ